MIRDTGLQFAGNPVELAPTVHPGIRQFQSAISQKREEREAP
jgi:hypothetical protein